MIKKLIFNFSIFISIFIFIDKVNALPVGNNFVNFDSNKVGTALFYSDDDTNNSKFYLYTVNGSDTSCGSQTEPNLSASKNCWFNRNLSFVRDVNNNLNTTNYNYAYRVDLTEALEVNHTYLMTMKIVANNLDYAKELENRFNNIKNVQDTTLHYSSMTCDSLECTLSLKITSLYTISRFRIFLSDVWNNYSINEAIDYMYYPKVTDISDSAFEFEDIEPAITMSSSSLEIAEDVNYTINNTSPTLTYGQATYDYIFNQFIPNELYLDYGKYYVCGGNGSAYRSICYISDSPDVFTVHYSSLGLDLYVNPSDEHKVYRYSINSGSKETSGTYSSSYITSLSQIIYLHGDYNNSLYAPNNLPYFKMGFSTYNTIKTSDGYIFNPGNIFLYKEGDNYVVNTDYKTVDDLIKVPERNIFDEYIEDYNYSKMIFDFDLSMLDARENIFDLLLNDFYVSNEIRDSVLYEVEPFEIGYPYFEYTTSSGFKGIFYLKDLDGNDIISKKKMYAGKYLDTLPEDTVSLKFIIPLLDTVDYQLKVSLVSFYSYTISYETYEEEYLYRDIVELTGKYGAIFMPKLVENNSDIKTSFETWSIEKVLVYDTYNYDENPIKTYIDDVTTFDYVFKYQDIYHNLFFVADSNSSYSAIEYDTRYFDYCVFDESISSCTVINPNTKEEFHIYINLGTVDSFGVSNIFDTFFNFSDSTNFILENITFFYNNYLPNDLKVYFYICFGFTVIIVITKIVL